MALKRLRVSFRIVEMLAPQWVLGASYFELK